MITKRARLWLSRGVALAVIVLILVVIGSTWFYAGEIESALLSLQSPDPTPDLVVTDVGARSVTLPLTAATSAPGTWGLRYEGGHAEMGDVLAADDATVTRELLAATGRLAAGTPVAVDRTVFGDDPGDVGLAYDDVLVEGPLGDYPAWVIDGAGTIWAIVVHDRGADRREALRIVPTLAAAGMPTMVITYRNDAGAPPGGGGHAGMGRNEWTDLDAAVDYAVAEGATDVVLVGYGVGGSIVEVFMDHSRQTGRVVGVVLDAPLLDPAGRVDDMAAEDKVPGFMLAWSKAVATLRFGIDWGDLDHLARAPETAVPTLILHGDADPRYPVAISREFAAAAPFFVTLVEVPGAGHGEAWNVDPVGYGDALAGFVSDLVATVGA
jgi:alpha-beta hydrolase superfamily lysophospholipase